MTRLQMLAAAWNGCQRCELWKVRNSFVFGRGRDHPRIVLMGEAPGRTEDLIGRPFGGAAGNMLREAEGEAGTISERYIMNVLGCRPPNNRPPRPVEVEACRPRVVKMIEALEARIIVSMGNTATKLLTGQDGVTRMRGQTLPCVLDGITIPILPTYHPSAALRKGGVGSVEYGHLVSDLKLALELAGG